MREGRIILWLAVGITFISFIPIQAEEIVCPSKCRCSFGFIAVKCPGLDAFPVFDFAASVQSLDLSRGHITDIDKNHLKAYENLQNLDIRDNELKSVAPGLFSEMESLRRLYIDNNPWSCDTSTLHVLQMELIALVEKNSHLDNFDGGRIKCFDPPDMKGKKPLYLRNLKAHFVHNLHKTAPHQPTPGGVIALVVFLVLILMAAGFGIIWSFRENISMWIWEFWKPAASSEQESKMEAGELETKSLLTDSMTKRRRMSRAIPAANRTTSSSDEEKDDKKVAKTTQKLKVKRRKQRSQSYGSSKGAGNTEGETSGLSTIVNQTDIYLQVKLKEQRRQSCGFPVGDNSSDGDERGLSTAVDKVDYLKDKLKQQRRQSCGFPEGDGSSGEDSKFTTIDLNLN